MSSRASRSLLALVLLLSAFVLPVHARSQRDALPAPVPAVEPAAVPAEAAQAGLSAPQWSSITEQISNYERQLRGDASALDLEESVKVTAPDGSPDDRLGNAVAMACDMLLVAAFGDEAQTGAAYLFERNVGGADGWGLVKKLVPNDATSDDWSGYSVALSCDIAVVGAPGAGGSAEGAAYVFYRNYDPDDPEAPSPDNWGQIKKLSLGEAAASDDRFGMSVAIDCDTIAVSAPYRAGESYDHEGAVYLYTRNYDPADPEVPRADNWGLTHVLDLGSDGQDLQTFGWSLDLDCSTLVVGSPYLDWDDMEDAGAAYVYGRQEDPEAWGQWQFITRLVPQLQEASATFGDAVAVSCDTILIGSPGYLDGDGMAVLFQRNFDSEDPEYTYADEWDERAVLRPPTEGVGGQFGGAVALDCDRAVVGEFRGGDDEEGRAYVFERNYYPDDPDMPIADNWGLVETLLASDPEEEGAMGNSVAICSDWIAAGAPRVLMAAGAVYLFELPDCELLEAKRLTGSEETGQNAFGYAIALACDTLVVGYPGHYRQDHPAGAAFVFYRNQDGAENWGYVTTLYPDETETSDEFGVAVAADCDVIVVGAPGDHGRGSTGPGAAYIYVRNYDPSEPDAPAADNWGLVKRLTGSGIEDEEIEDDFGRSVGADCDRVIVGAPHDFVASGDEGYAYLFDRDYDPLDPGTPSPNSWGLVAKLHASDGAPGDGLGRSVALSCDTAVVGAHYADVDGDLNAGAAYVFERNFDPESPETPNPDDWGQVTKLVAKEGQADHYFGAAVDIDCDTIVVGAPGASGGAYLFTRNYDPAEPGTPSADHWGLLADLTPVDGLTDIQFGHDVAIGGDRAVVGAPGYDTEYKGGLGALYVFERNLDPDYPATPAPDYWGQLDRLTTLLEASYGHFGYSADLGGELVAGGAPYEATGSATGAVYLFGCTASAEPMATLEIDKWHSPEPVTAAWNFTYYIDITNTAEVAATNVVITDTLPAGVAAYSVQPGQGGTFDGVSTVVWTLASLGPGESARFSIKSRTYSTAAGKCLTNVAGAAADNAEGVSANDEACVVKGELTRPTPTPTPAATPVPPGTTVTIKKGGPGTSLDTYIYRNQPYSNYWLEPLLKVGYKQTNATLIQFDLSPIPAGAQVEEAWLEVFATGWSGPGADMVIGAYAISETVLISQTTWVSPELGSLWALAGANDLVLDRRPLPESTVTTTGPLLWYRFDVSQLTQEWLDGATANNGLLLRCESCMGRGVRIGQPEDSPAVVAEEAGDELAPPTNGLLPGPLPGNLCTNSFFFASAEYSNPSLGPRLVVRYQ